MCSRCNWEIGGPSKKHFLPLWWDLRNVTTLILIGREGPLLMIWATCEIPELITCSFSGKTIESTFHGKNDVKRTGGSTVGWRWRCVGTYHYVTGDPNCAPAGVVWGVRGAGGASSLVLSGKVPAAITRRLSSDFCLFQFEMTVWVQVS